MARRDVDIAIAAIACKQQGVFSLAQLQSVGGNDDLARRRCRAGHWRRVAPGVYLITGSPASWKQQLMVATLGAGDDALVSHRAAASLWRLDGFHPGIVEISVPHGRMPTHARVRVHQMSEIIPADIDVVDGIPVTSPTRTLIDAAWYVDPPTFEIAVESARRKGLTTIPKFRWRFSELTTRGRPGAATVRGFLEQHNEAAGISRSELETRFDQLATAAGLPPALRQVRVLLPGGKSADIDRYWPQFELAVELDGAETHTGPVALHGDLTRQNGMVLLGHPPLRFTWSHVTTEPDYVIATLRAAFTKRVAA